jgi:hypothetical protein
VAWAVNVGCACEAAAAAALAQQAVASHLCFICCLFIQSQGVRPYAYRTTTSLNPQSVYSCQNVAWECTSRLVLPHAFNSAFGVLDALADACLFAPVGLLLQVTSQTTSVSGNAPVVLRYNRVYPSIFSYFPAVHTFLL